MTLPISQSTTSKSFYSIFAIIFLILILVMCVMWRKIYSCFESQKRQKSVLNQFDWSIIDRRRLPKPEPSIESEALPQTSFGRAVAMFKPFHYHIFRIDVDDTKTITENTPSQYDHAEIFFLKKQLTKFNIVRLIQLKKFKKVNSNFIFYPLLIKST